MFIGFFEFYGIIVVIFERWSESLRKSYRVKRERDFNDIFTKGNNVANRRCVV